MMSYNPAPSCTMVLGRMLRSSVGAVRSRAAEILLVSLQHPDAGPSSAEAWQKVVPILVESTRSPDAKIRSTALTLLALLGPEATCALKQLQSLASESNNAAVRQSVEAAISSIQTLEGLKARDPAARIAAADSLSRMHWRATRGIPALIDALKDEETKVRVAAAHALGTLAGKCQNAVTPLLSALPGEPEASARAAFLEALEAIAPGSPACSMPIGTLYATPIPWCVLPQSLFAKCPPTIRGSPRPQVGTWRPGRRGAAGGGAQSGSGTF